MQKKKPKGPPEWVKKYKEKGKEVKLIRGNYYLCEYRSEYCPEKKRSKKISGKMLLFSSFAAPKGI